MAQKKKNRGKQFESVVRACFEKVPDISVDRIHDQTTKYKGSTNICDFVVYKMPHLFYLECKSVYGNVLSIFSNPTPDKKGVLHGFHGNITDAQWDGLTEKAKIPGVIAGIIVWFIDRNTTLFVPIQELNRAYNNGRKSIRFDDHPALAIAGKKKRIVFDYNMEAFLQEVVPWQALVCSTI